MKQFHLVIPSESFEYRNTFRTNLKYSEICVRANANQPKPIRKKFSIPLVENSLTINPTQTDSIRKNPNGTESNFQSESIRNQVDLNSLIKFRSNS